MKNYTTNLRSKYHHAFLPINELSARCQWWWRWRRWLWLLLWRL